MTLTPAIQRDAERIIVLTVSAARELPNLLGRICPAMLQAHGFYSANVGGVKTLYVRADAQ